MSTPRPTPRWLLDDGQGREESIVYVLTALKNH